MSIAAIIFILTGIFFFFVGVVGILRFPDFYSRLHAAGKADSLAAVLVTIGVAIYNLRDPSFANLLVSTKIMLIALFIYIASPTATHALTNGALVVGVEPWGKGRNK